MLTQMTAKRDKSPVSLGSTSTHWKSSAPCENVVSGEEGAADGHGAELPPEAVELMSCVAECIIESAILENNSNNSLKSVTPCCTTMYACMFYCMFSLAIQLDP